MGLKKYKLGELIKIIDERNSYGYTSFYGLNINKEFMPTWANTEGLDESKYKVVRKNRFVFSGMQTGRDECIRISMYNGAEPIIVSPAYTTFEVIREDLVIPEYFFMLFLSKEKDRFGAFCSDGSIRSNLDWERFCDFNITLPSISQQRKYIDVYLALQNNLATYQSKVDDLKLVCDGYIEELRRKMKCEKIGAYIKRYSDKNSDKAIEEVVGLSTEKKFRIAQSRVNRNELGGYKIVHPLDIAYVPTTDTWKVLAFAVNHFDKDVVVSPIYEVFTTTGKLKSDYLAIWLKREEFDRYARFNSWGSARENFTFEEMQEVEIPIPEESIQQAIIDMYLVYEERKAIATQLKEQLNRLCPILIKGSLQN